MKKLLLLFILFTNLFSFDYIYGASSPSVTCAGLPGCQSDALNNSGDSNDGTLAVNVLSNFIGEFIQIVAVFAVFALIFSGIFYLISSGDEEKANKAKKWIIWSLVGVFLSISAWGIINFINNINIL
ncbi:hypothetical protein HUU51_03565 [Candidatus Gracilibacteria bacterium]|nr:hypothetical protein [Candidatus Gracilibacteria bacterium]